MQKPIFNRILKRLKNREGVTLVELVITFALIAIFCAGVTQVITRSMIAYHNMRTISDAAQVADTIMEKVCGELSGAQPSIKRESDGESQSKGATCKIYDGGDIIEFYEKTGSHIAVTTTDHYGNIRCDQAAVEQFQGSKYQGRPNTLVIYYYAVDSTVTDDHGNESKVVRYEAVDWCFDKAVYRGYTIGSLTFEKAGDAYPGNVLKVSLSMVNAEGEVVTQASRYVECYNFTSTDYNKIEVQ